MAKNPKGTRDLARLLREIRACRICADVLDHEPRPVLKLKSTVKLCIVGQAPGLRVHESGIPFNDPSGERLRNWMGVTREEFYDERMIGIVPRRPTPVPPWPATIWTVPLCGVRPALFL